MGQSDRESKLQKTATMSAYANEVKLFGKWSFDDIEVLAATITDCSVINRKACSGKCVLPRISGQELSWSARLHKGLCCSPSSPTPVCR